MEKQTIYLAGDSTMADYSPESYPMQGWGNKLHLFIPDTVRVVNKAVCGRSSKRFIEEGRLEHSIHPNYPEGIEDNTHLNEQGAEAVAQLVADATDKLNLKIA